MFLFWLFLNIAISLLYSTIEKDFFLMLENVIPLALQNLHAKTHTLYLIWVYKTKYFERRIFIHNKYININSSFYFKLSPRTAIFLFTLMCLDTIIHTINTTIIHTINTKKSKLLLILLLLLLYIYI